MKWFVARQVYLPSWPLSLILLGLLLGFTGIFMVGIVPFLALDQLLEKEDLPGEDILLVVEGWVPDHVIAEGVRIFRDDGYKEVGVTGGPTTGASQILRVKTFAEYGAQRLIERGIPAERIIVAPAYSVDRRRTQRTAIDLRRELAKRGAIPKAINVITTDVHARRSRLIYRRVFGEGVAIGIRGVAPDDFDPKRWWKTSSGVKTVLLEAMSLIYDAFSPTAV